MHNNTKTETQFIVLILMAQSSPAHSQRPARVKSAKGGQERRRVGQTGLSPRRPGLVSHVESTFAGGVL